MFEWNHRNEIEANLFNPPFLSFLCYETVKGYENISESEAPFVLPFLVIPFVLSKEIREKIPKTKKTKFIPWVAKEENSFLKVGYEQRIKAFTPYVREAIMFAYYMELMDFSKKGNLKVKKKLESYIDREDLTEEVKDCIKKAKFCGEWFASTGSISTVMVFLGVRP